MDHTQPNSDTDPRAMEVWLDRLRRMTPGEKILSALQLGELTMRMAEMGVRMQYPDASPREVFLRSRARYLGRDLMIRAYGWDPEAHSEPVGSA